MGCLRLEYLENPSPLRVLNGGNGLIEENDVESYRFAYNGMEYDEQVKGGENSYTTEFRQYDPRLGRWLSIDPLANKQPDQSPYKALLNNPIFYVDNGGDTEYHITIRHNEKTGKTTVTIKVVSADVMTDGARKTIWANNACYHVEQYYYDFARITVINIDKNGKKTEKNVGIEIFTSDIKDVDWVLFGGDDKYDTHSEWETPKDKGVEVTFGIEMTGESDASAIDQDKSKNAIGDMNYDEISKLLSKWSTSSSKYESDGSWIKIDASKVNEWLESYKKGTEFGEKIEEITKEVNKVRGSIKKNEPSKDKDTTIIINQWERGPNTTVNHAKDTVVKKSDVKKINQNRKWEKQKVN